MLIAFHYLVMLHRSYDTGEDKRPQEALIQENRFSYINKQCKVPTKIFNLTEPQFHPSYSDIFFSIEFSCSSVGLSNNIVAYLIIVVKFLTSSSVVKCGHMYAIDYCLSLCSLFPPKHRAHNRTAPVS